MLYESEWVKSTTPLNCNIDDTLALNKFYEYSQHSDTQGLVYNKMVSRIRNKTFYALMNNNGWLYLTEPVSMDIYSIGALIITHGTIPLDNENSNTAFMSIPWLLVTIFGITFSTLYSKTCCLVKYFSMKTANTCWICINPLVYRTTNLDIAVCGHFNNMNQAKEGLFQHHKLQTDASNKDLQTSISIVQENLRMKEDQALQIVIKKEHFQALLSEMNDPFQQLVCQKKELEDDLMTAKRILEVAYHELHSKVVTMDHVHIALSENIKISSLRVDLDHTRLQLSLTEQSSTDFKAEFTSVLSVDPRIADLQSSLDETHVSFLEKNKHTQECDEVLKRTLQANEEAQFELLFNKSSQSNMGAIEIAVTTADIAIKFNTPKLSYSLFQYIQVVSKLLKQHLLIFRVQYAACMQFFTLTPMFNIETMQVDPLELHPVHTAMFHHHIIKLVEQAVNTSMYSPEIHQQILGIVYPLTTHLMGRNYIRNAEGFNALAHLNTFNTNRALHVTTYLTQCKDLQWSFSVLWENAVTSGNQLNQESHATMEAIPLTFKSMCPYAPGIINNISMCMIHHISHAEYLDALQQTLGENFLERFKCTKHESENVLNNDTAHGATHDGELIVASNDGAQTTFLKSLLVEEYELLSGKTLQFALFDEGLTIRACTIEVQLVTATTQQEQHFAPEHNEMKPLGKMSNLIIEGKNALWYKAEHELQVINWESITASLAKHISELKMMLEDASTHTNIGHNECLEVSLAATTTINEECLEQQLGMLESPENPAYEREHLLLKNSMYTHNARVERLQESSTTANADNVKLSIKVQKFG